MNEVFDQLLIKFIFASYLCLLIFIYKYAHGIIYPLKYKIHYRFIPSKNISETLHLLTRIFGIALIFSSFNISLEQGIPYALLDIFLLGSCAVFLFIISTYIIESIVMYNFEYIDEVEKKKNIAYSLISVVHTIGLSLIISTVLKNSLESITLILFSWLFSMVIIGLLSKGHSFYSKLPFNRLVLQSDLSVAFSYAGYFIGWSLIITSALNHPIYDMRWYAISSVLKILMALIFIPLFLKILIFIFNIHEDFNPKESAQDDRLYRDKTLAYGVYEGIIFIAGCFLTIAISEQITFGSFYLSF